MNSSRKYIMDFLTTRHCTDVYNLVTFRGKTYHFDVCNTLITEDIALCKAEIDGEKSAIR